MHRRTPAVLSTLTALSLSLGLPLASPARADGPVFTDGVVYAADSNGDGYYGLYRALDGGTTSALVPEATNNEIEQVSASQDGGRFTYLAYHLTGSATEGGSVTQQVVVRDASGRLVSTVASLTTPVSSTADVPEYDNPSLSPDGREVIWTQINGAGTTLHKADLGSGATTTVSGAEGALTWTYLNATTLLAVADLDTTPHLVTLPATGGSSTPVQGGVVDGNPDGTFRVSPDGTRIAWSHVTSATDAPLLTADLEVGNLSVSNGIATISSSTTLSTGLDSFGPSWTHDGQTVRFVKDNGDPNDPVGAAYSVPADGSAAPVQTTTGTNVATLGNVVVDDSAPGAATASPFTLAGTRATLRWTLPADADLSGVSITRTGGSGPKSFLVPAPATSVVDTGLTVGTTYSYAISAVDHSNLSGEASTRSLTAILPFARFADPTSTSSTKTAFPVALPGVGTYTVRYRLNSSGGTRTWISGGAGASHTFGLAPAGSSVALNVQAFDAYGNSSLPTSAGTATVPYDQGRASFVGTHRTVRRADAYLGTTTQLQKAGAKAQISLTGNRFQVIGERCSTCGVMDVYVDGVRVAGIDTKGARHARTVLFTRSLSPGSHQVVVKARGTSRRPNVVLDGFGIRR